MPGLGSSFGRGAATTYLQDLANSDCILIMGSNMAEAHPVGFRWPMKAREKGGTLIHVDPRFSRTSAMCNQHVQIRAGSDIAFLGALIRYVLENRRWMHDYVVNYTNAAQIIDEGFQDVEELDGVFSGYDRESREYEPKKGKWNYERPPGYDPHEDFPDMDEAHRGSTGVHGQSLQGGASTHGNPRGLPTAGPVGNMVQDESLQHPRCVFQILRRHYARYTPEIAAEICGCRAEEIIQVAEALCNNSGAERTSAICYAVGWTQHTTGVQMIRAATILQLLLGNIGRPGGGVMALRGHCSIQGSTDIPTLYDLLPGYLPQPTADEPHDNLDTYCEFESFPTGYWSNFKKFAVSLLKAYYGEAATPENQFGFHWIPRLDADYSMLPILNRMIEGKMRGYFVIGQNPAGGSPNAGLARHGLRKLDWLVVCDWFMTETATFWKDDPTGPPPEEVATEVFFLPAATIAEKEGSFTNTQRLLQWHDKALDPPDDCRTDLWWIYNLGKKLKELYKDSTDPKDQGLLNLTWDYDYNEPPRLPDGSLSTIEGEPDANKVLKEINGYDLTTGKLVSGFADLKDDGTTSSGCWIYSGVFPEENRNRARERNRTENPLQPQWGFAWPKNRRILYNRASARPDGQPWSERKKLMWWDADKGEWGGADVPDFQKTKAPTYEPPVDSKGMDAVAGNAPFIMKPYGKASLYSDAVKDGPLPTHYEPVESPVKNMLYAQHDNPTTRYQENEENRLAHEPTPEFPIVGCTFRVTEHYLSGPMSRFNSWLNELMPAMFIELSPELAEEVGVVNGGWVTVVSARGRIEARALVTRRQRPMRVHGKLVHQIGIPFHWGYAGEIVGSVANDLTSLVLDPNVSIHEAKVFTCRVEAGRTRPQPERPTETEARWTDGGPAAGSEGERIYKGV